MLLSQGTRPVQTYLSSFPVLILIVFTCIVLGGIIGWQLTKRSVRKEMAVMQAEINLRSIEVLEAKTHLRKLTAHLNTALKTVSTKSDLLARQHSLLINTDEKLINAKRDHEVTVQQYEEALSSLKSHVTTLAGYVKLMRSDRARPAPAAASQRSRPEPVSIQAVKQPDNTVQITRINSSRIASTHSSKNAAANVASSAANRAAPRAGAAARKQPR